MEVKLKLKNIIEINSVLRQETEQCESIPIKFKLLGILNKLKFIIDEYEDIRYELFKKYGTKNDDGSMSIPTNSKEMQNFVLDSNEILETIHTITIDKIKLQDVNNFSIDTLEIIYPILEE